MTINKVCLDELQVGDIVKIEKMGEKRLSPESGAGLWGGSFIPLNTELVIINIQELVQDPDDGVKKSRDDTCKRLYLFDKINNKAYTVNTERTEKLFEKVGRISKKDENLANIVFEMPRRTSDLLKVGADPEVFIQERGSKKHIGAFEILPSKQAVAEGGAYWDGFQAEFNTEPYACLAYHTDSLHRNLKRLYESLKEKETVAKKTGKRKELLLSTKTVINLTETHFKKAKREHLEFGCMPSFNAYKETSPIMNGADVPFRMAGGHLHFGWPERLMPSKMTRVSMVKAMDAVLGVACVSLFAKYDDKRRRKLYGRAGEFRLPEHGLEYRVLSNAWLIHPVFAQLVFELGRKALFMGEHNLLDALWDATEEETRKCINECDVKLAKKLLTRNEKVLTAILASITREWDDGKRLFKLFMDGAESILNPNKGIKENWLIDVPVGYDDITHKAVGWRNHSFGVNCSIDSVMRSLKAGAKEV